jgi:Trypsin-co-occurring domain 2
MSDAHELPQWAPVELAAAIQQIRSQLADAIEAGKGSPVAFKPGPVELELEVAFSATGGGDFGVKAYVLSIAAKGEVSKEATNRVKLTLTPVGPAGEELLIGSVGAK